MTRVQEMQQHPAYQIALTLRLLLMALFVSVPSEFWTQVDALLDIPVSVKVLIAPLLGSAVATGAEYLAFLKLRQNNPALRDPMSSAYWWIKILIGWIVGAYGGPAAEGFIKAEPPTIAFWAGLGGYGTVAIYLAVQDNKLNKEKNGNTPAPPTDSGPTPG